MHLQPEHRRGNRQGEAGGGEGELGVELCKVIYQANISNKLVKYYVIKLSAHAQQQSDTHARTHRQRRVVSWGAGGVAGLDWHMFRNVSINFTQHLI